MDIEEFYDADPRRRASDELEFGRDWHDSFGNRFELSWVAATGELYAMLEVIEPVVDVLGAEFSSPVPTSSVTVEVLGTLPERDTVLAVLDDWRSKQGDANSIAWVRDRLAAHQAGTLVVGTIDADDEPDDSVRGAGH